MIPTMLLASFLASQPGGVRVPVYQPKLNVRIQLPQPPRDAARRMLEQFQTVCGMPMARKSPDIDPSILRPRRDNRAEIAEPPPCGAQRAVPAK